MSDSIIELRSIYKFALKCKIYIFFQGQTKQRNFGEVKFKLCPTEGFAREHFKKAGCEHYWDHAYSTAVLASSEM